LLHHVGRVQLSPQARVEMEPCQQAQVRPESFQGRGLIASRRRHGQPSKEKDTAGAAVRRAGAVFFVGLLERDPSIDDREPGPIHPGTIGEIISGPLRKVAPGSSRHLALVEAVRRLYKQAAIDADRADKIRAMNP
jgi:hypothetical protein